MTYIDDERFPEWRAFVDAVRQRRPDAGTWCEAWTVRDIVIHQGGNAEELARVLGAHLESEPVSTRGFEEREAPLRALGDADLWVALTDRMSAPNRVAAAADEVSTDTDVAWTGRTMKVAGTDDVVVSADAGRTAIEVADPDGPATLEADAAARVLLLWGRRPADPARICSRVGPEALGRVRRLLSGY